MVRMRNQEELQGALLQKALEEYKSGLFGVKTLRDESLKNRRKFIIRLENYLNGKPFNENSARDFIQFLKVTKTGKPAAPSAIATHVGKIRALGQFLVTQGYIEKNFCQNIPRPTKDQLQTPITPLAPEILLKAIKLGTTPTKYDRGRSRAVKADSRIALLFALHTGRRRSEILKLKGEDLNLDDKPPSYWATLKGGRRHMFEIPPVKMLLTGLRERQNREKVFQITGEVMIKHLNDGLRKMKVNKKVVVHDLRDVFAIERLRNKEEAFRVGRLLGHKRLQTTLDHYVPYILTDYSETLRNSSIIRHGLSVSEIADNIRDEVQRKAKDDRFLEARTTITDKGISIEIPFSKSGLREISR